VNILLIEDDVKIAHLIRQGMEEENFSVEHCENGDIGLKKALSNPFDAAIIDIMLPGCDGLSVIDDLRKHGISLPVLILSAKRSVDDRVKGFKIGGDDYLTKPFAFSELLARIQALLRRTNNTSEPTGLTVHDLTINTLTRKVTRAGRKINLQPREFSLLEYLMRNAGRVVTKSMIIEHVWDYNFDPHTNVVEARVSRLRDKIDKEFDTALIHTIRGAGYVLKPG
jgi:two-component system OmpR family response regulator